MQSINYIIIIIQDYMRLGPVLMKLEDGWLEENWWKVMVYLIELNTIYYIIWQRLINLIIILIKFYASLKV